MIEYEIEGGNLPVVICYPKPGETLVTESGAMSWMSPNMKMSTNTGGGIKKLFGRMFSGESLFINEYTAMMETGTIAFASSFPGSIIPYHVTPGNGIIVQKKGFLAMEKGLDLSVYFQKKLSRGFFGGEGFIMQKISGDGLVFLEISGYCKEYVLEAGQSMIMNTGYLAAMSDTCTMDIQMVKGVKNVFLGGEGLFNTCVTGPGKVYIQSMPISNMAQVLTPYIEINTNNDHGGGGGGFSIRLGD